MTEPDRPSCIHELTERDSDGDGQPNNVYDYIYDENRRLIAMNYFYANSNVESRTEYQYDMEGPEQRFVRYEADHEGDGVLDDIRTYEHNEMGDQIREEIDIGADGTIDSVALNEYLYDHAGRILRWDQLREGDGLLRRIEYTYDDLGRLLSTSDDDDGDGQVDSLVTYAYSENGRTVTIADGDGNLIALQTLDDEGRVVESMTRNQVLTMVYDDAGNELERRTEHRQSGVLQDHTTNDWVCE